ncbi:hypothetical protein [Kineosporia sp. NBRC 101731]|uniref:hypothetical protein n=1 Tax=Kineosporia sp. NBRC 101731 TaxID=3032199 RepID=UPI0024A3B76E|nr:hypothetical protein [Kineosporia sp. NBRC 101731]GLY30015.1 hypothetical protein Kisp02_33800 [Kineosporia sp. NBRC 101731]
MHQRLSGAVRLRRSTPDLLLAAGVVVLSVAVLAGVFGREGLARRAGSLEQARAETAQQVRIQTARTALVIADTDAGNDLLTGADPGQFSYRLFAYDAQPAFLGLVTAARTDEDAASLATANKYLTRYVMQVAAARTLAQDGRRDEAAGALAEASQVLHTQVLPRLAQVQQAGRERLADDGSAADTAPVITVLAGILAVLVIIAVHLWLTRRTRRLLNLGLLTGVVVLVLVTVAGVAVVVASRQQVSQVQDHALRIADAVVEARFSAFDARSSEARAALDGSTVDGEQAWQASYQDALARLRTAAAGEPQAVRDDVANVTGKLSYYGGVHERLLARAVEGDDAFVRRSASNPAPGGAVGAFEAFDAYSGALLARQVQTADDAWESAGANLRLVGWITLVVGLLAAVLGWVGIAARRREYR